jgi:DNA-binding PadR family transcriptional regulator
VHSKLDGLGRFAEPWLLILTSLADGPKHGYAIMTDVAAFSGVRMEPGTLYGALSRLERRGWVRPLATARMRSRPPGQAGQVKTMRPVVRADPGRPCAATAVDSPHDIHYNLVSGTDEWGMGMHGKFDDLGRFADPSLLILTSLADGPKHGYAIMTDVAGFSGVRMEPGTLYGALSRLERRGWIRPLATAERRRPYQITAAGQEILAEQVTTMQQIVQVARLRTATAWGA